MNIFAKSFFLTLVVFGAQIVNAGLKPLGTVESYHCAKNVDVTDIAPTALVAPVGSVCWSTIAGLRPTFLVIDSNVWQLIDRKGQAIQLQLVGTVVKNRYQERVATDSIIAPGEEMAGTLRVKFKYYTLSASNFEYLASTRAL